MAAVIRPLGFEIPVQRARAKFGHMVIIVIGGVALVASVNSWFPPGIALGLGLIGLGVALGLAPRG
jgi:hypothetical protein